MTIDIKSFITIEDSRTQNNYIETHHLKSLLIYIFDQPILDCYLQEKSLPNINITLSAEDKIVHLKIFIFAAYKPNEQSLYSCEEIIKYNDGNITILARNDYIVWDVSFISK